MKRKIGLVFISGLFLLSVSLKASPLVSPTWGFSLDLPEGYELSGGDRKDRFSFSNPEGAVLDLVVYGAQQTAAQSGRTGSTQTYNSVEELAEDVQKRLGSTGDSQPFLYGNKSALFFELSFSASSGQGRSAVPNTGWGLCLELEQVSAADRAGTAGAKKNLLLALAYGPAAKENLRIYHLSALDSIAPAAPDRKAPGPITEFSYPRVIRRPVRIAGLELEALMYENDAEAAQALVDREFALLKRYVDSQQWREAWIRFYRAVYRDSFDRLAHSAFILERCWTAPSAPSASGQNPAQASPASQNSAPSPEADRNTDSLSLASKALAWVQSFKYERDLMGSDFVNLVSALTEGRGDCDSRSMLWAIILNHADIPAHIMVSRYYSHAMGLTGLEAKGAHFAMAGKQWLVAETTAQVNIGLIGQNVSEIDKWLGIEFE
jgi:hypothetical protein